MGVIRSKSMVLVVLLGVVQIASVRETRAQDDSHSDSAQDRDQDRDRDTDNVTSLGSDADVDSPWTAGVSSEAREQARMLFKKGNKLIQDQFFKQAAEHYLEALDHWDHPAIHFNRSLALTNLDQPLELYHSLKKALEHGVPPLLEKANFKRAENYLNIVSKQIGHIVVVCKQQGVRVIMDGKPLFTGPGIHKGITLAGDHTIRATKDGYLPDEKVVVLSAGEHEQIQLRLFTEDEITVAVRRMPSWIPWATLGGGALLLSLGGVMHNMSDNGFNRFDTEFDALCVDLRGCMEEGLSPELSGTLDGSRLQQNIGRISYVLGGAALVTGVALVFINRPKRVRREIPDDGDAGINAMTITPMVDRASAGVSARIRF